MFSDFTTYRSVVEGYPERWSYQAGDVVHFHCSSSTPTFSVEIARIIGRFAQMEVPEKQESR